MISISELINTARTRIVNNTHPDQILDLYDKESKLKPGQKLNTHHKDKSMYKEQYRQDPLFFLEHPPDSERQLLRLQQNLLKWLLHCQWCCANHLISNTRCSAVQCRRIYPLMCHMNNCEGGCNVPLCAECKAMLAHFDVCNDNSCLQCREMRWLTLGRFNPDPSMRRSINPNLNITDEDRGSVIAGM